MVTAGPAAATTAPDHERSVRMRTPTRRSWLFISILAAGCFTTGLNVGVLSPLVTLVGRDLGASDAAVGQAAALHAVIAGLTALLVAPWVDRYPRRLVLQIEGLLLLAATAISALAPSLPWLFLGRALAGIGGAIIAAVCFAAVGDLFAEAAQRNRAIGILSTAFYTATIAGLTIVTQLADIAGWRWALASLLVPTALVALGSAWLPAVAPAAPGRQRPGGYGAVLAHPPVAWLLAVVVVLCLVRAGWEVFFGAFTATAFAIGAHALSLLFLIGGCAQILASNLTPVLLRRRPAPSVFVGATLLVSAGLLAVSALTGAWWRVIPFVVLFGLAWPVLYLTATVLLLDALPGARGAVMSLQTGCFEFGWAAGAAVSGAALAAFHSYAPVHRLLALLLPVSLLFLGAAARRTRAAGDQALTAA